MPKQTKIVKRVLDHVSADMLEQVASSERLMNAFIAQFPEETPESYREKIRQGSFPVGKGVEKIHSLAGLLPIYQALLRRESEVTLVGAPSGQEFLTSDNPVNTLWQEASGRNRFGGIVHPESQIWFPITPDWGLYIGSDRNRVKRRENIGPFCTLMNQRIVDDAGLFVISPTSSDELTEMLKFPPMTDRDHLLETMPFQQVGSDA